MQELWHNLEAVFDSRGLGHEFGEEAVRFASADKIWKSLMKTSIETKNVIQVRWILCKRRSLPVHVLVHNVMLLCKWGGGGEESVGRWAVHVLVVVFFKYVYPYSAVWEMISLRLQC